jgi:hypothetical protein
MLFFLNETSRFTIIGLKNNRENYGFYCYVLAKKLGGNMY